MLQLNGRHLACVLALSAAPALALADGVSVRYKLSDPAGSPFPSDRFSVTDLAQQTSRRVRLPLPDCAVRVSDCQDIRVLNTLDGFSTQPRITIPFDGPIDPSTVNSKTVYLVNLGDTLNFQGIGEVVGINQIVWDPNSNTLVFQPDKLLEEHTRYLVLVTDGVRDTRGKKIKPINLFDDVTEFRRDTDEYRRTLRDALRNRFPGSLNVAAASLFTTQSISSDLYRIMKSLKNNHPRADFMIGNDGQNAVRSVFPTAGVKSMVFNRQESVGGALKPYPLPLTALGVAGPTVAQVAYGRYDSPSYLNTEQYIPAVDTLHGVPQVQRNEHLVFQLFMPAGKKPVNGWPVAIFGHGFTDSMYGAPWAVASSFAKQGIATLAIQVVGHGGGAAGQLQIVSGGKTIAVPAGGRGFDQDHNGSIDSTEGVNAAAPYTVLGNRDGLRQTVIDIMQLVQMVKTGVDVDGDGTVDLDANRIYYSGQSFGGIYGTMLLGVEPDIKAGVPNVAGGSITEVARLGGFRPLTGIALASRVPSLKNVDDPVNPYAFNENIPLRNLPPLINTVPGAMAIQRVLDWDQWAQQSGNPVSYAPYIRKAPLPGNQQKPVIFQFARGDQTVPNPTTTAILRAGDLGTYATQFRNDLAVKATGAAKNPHTFLTNLSPANAPYALGAQNQIATFFASGVVIDPDDSQPFFEVPTGNLPETLNFIQ